MSEDENNKSPGIKRPPTKRKRQRFWLSTYYKGKKAGAPRIFESPQQMWEVASAYFKYVEDNPILEEVLVPYKGDAFFHKLQKARPMTLEGFLRFASIGEMTWYDYAAREEFRDVVAKIKGVMFEQKFSGACAGLFNPAIIWRELGLADKNNNTHEVGDTLSRFLKEVDGKNTGLPGDASDD